MAIDDGAPTFDIQGVSMSVYGPYDYESLNYPLYLQNEVAMGANYVELSSQALIDTTTGAVTDLVVNGGDETATFSSIGPAIAQAEADGLNVMLKPQIAAYDPWLTQFGGSPYGNMTDPNLAIPNPAAFFAGYKAYILQWAELAQQYHVPILSIGNEMYAVSGPQYTSYWDDIIAAVRQVYDGKLTYAALGWEASQVQFWNKLDYVGVDVYPVLESAPDASVQSMDAAWQTSQYFSPSALASLAASTGKPILFTETGAPSYPGAVDGGSASVLSAPTTPSDNQEQANYWQSFFDTWGANPPAWLAGIFAWNNEPADTGVWYSNGWDIYGKPAANVIASWFGGKDYLLSESQSAIAGTASNDQIYLYGQPASGAAAPTNEGSNFSTTLTVEIAGTIMAGAAPVLDFTINGKDFGATALSTVPGGYVDGNGVTWSFSNLSFTLPGLAPIESLKIVFESPVSVGGPENSQINISTPYVDGVPLTNMTYTPAGGSPIAELFPTSSTGSGTSQMWNGGSATFDATPWNTALAARDIGAAADPIQVSGGGGTDTVHVLGDIEQYAITQSNGVVHLRESAGLDQNADLTGVAQVAFSDYMDVFDLNSSQDLLVYQIYQAAYGRVPDNAGFRFWAGVADANKSAALWLADQFLSASEFSQIYGSNPTNLTYVTELYEHVLGRAPDQTGLNYWVGQANAGQPRDQLLVDFATSPENVSLIAPHTSAGYWTTY